jgi:hypothetical protein
MKTDTVPLPVSLTLRIRRLRRGQSILLGYADGISARAMASRLAKAAPGLKYITRREGDGIRLWRKA